MIGVKFQGRLGNQMFQYAFGISLEKKLNTAFFVDDSNQTNYLNQFFILRRPTLYYLKIDFFFYKQIIKNILRKRHFEVSLNYYIQKNNNKEVRYFQIIEQKGYDIARDWKNKIINNALYVGFFQSSEYLPKLKEINKYFRIKSTYRKIYEKKYKDIFNNSKTIVVHVRRTDYTNWGSDELGGENLTLPFNYYCECLNDIENIDQYKVFFISDDICFVKKNVQNKDNFYFEFNDEIIDFQLLINADVLILANSSFSWWGAFLNTKINKIVYAPKYWLGFKIKNEYPVGVIEKSWKQIEMKTENCSNYINT